MRFSPMLETAIRLIAWMTADLPFCGVSLLSPIELSTADKLQVLQRLDQFRKWQSLDEKRYCLGCSRIITGRDIYVVGGTRGTGPLRLICPTRRCHSIPMDWVLPTNEVLTSISILKDTEDAPKAKSSKPRTQNLVARLRNLATRHRPAA
jgi:hypothetical protein